MICCHTNSEWYTILEDIRLAELESFIESALQACFEGIYKYIFLHIKDHNMLPKIPSQLWISLYDNKRHFYLGDADDKVHLILNVSDRIKQAIRQTAEQKVS